jgi:hypothetical protein
MPRERVPLQWAATQNDLGNVLLVLGQHESGVAQLERSIAAYLEALKEWTRDRAPLDLGDDSKQFGPRVLDPRRA